MEFHPPFEKRTTEELIKIAISTTEEWQHEAIIQAKEELLKRNIPALELQNRIEIIRNEKLKQEKIERIHNNVKATASYTGWQLGLLFILAPIVITEYYGLSGKSLWRLNEEGYKLMFKQRFIALIAGITFWVVYFKLFII